MPDCGAGNSGRGCVGVAAGAGVVVGGEQLLMKQSSVKEMSKSCFRIMTIFNIINMSRVMLKERSTLKPH